MNPLGSRHPETGLGAAVRSFVARHPVFAFVGLAYAFSWAWWLPQAFGGPPVRVGVGWPTHLPGLLGPGLAALVVTAVVEGRAGLRDLWRRSIRWRVGWWWLSVVVILLAGAIAVIATGGAGDVAALTGYPGVSSAWGALGTIAFVFVVNGFGEELGWRGFAVERLSQHHTLLPTALVVALVWAPWHLPVFFVTESFQAYAAADVAGWAIGLTAGSVVLAWLYCRASSSVLLVAAWHTAFNFTSATPATSGALAAASSTLVMVAAVAIVAVELRRSLRTRGHAPDAAATRRAANAERDGPATGRARRDAKAGRA
jgi:membrane protease YdiL (CAAX protease family)